MPSPASAALASNGANLWLESCEQASFPSTETPTNRGCLWDKIHSMVLRADAVSCSLRRDTRKPAIRQSICSGLVKTFQNACQQLSGPNVFPMAGIDDDFRIEDTLLLGVLCMAVCNLLSSLPILHQTADPVGSEEVPKT